MQLELDAKLKDEVKVIYESGSPYFFEDLEGLINLHLSILNKAVNSNALLPYMDYATNVLNNLLILNSHLLDTIKDIKVYRSDKTENNNLMLPLGPAKFTDRTFEFCIYENELDRAAYILKHDIKGAKNIVDCFGMRKRFLSNDIKLELVSDILFKGVLIYLAEGKIIMPATIKSPGYHVFNLHAVEHDQKPEFCMEPITEYGLDSVETAIERYVKIPSIYPIVVAKNTEYYPLVETAMPIAKENYEKCFIPEKRCN